MVRVSKEGEKSMKHEEVKEVAERPSLISISEFLNSIRKNHPIESSGAFVYWMKKDGMPKRWPLKMWQDKFEEFLNRKV